MSIADKVVSGFNKAQDLVLFAKGQFEKNCDDFVCFSLVEPLKSVKVKAILDRSNYTIDISGTLHDFASLPKPYVFVNSSGTMFSIKEGSDKLETFVVEGKTKEKSYPYTKATICFVALETKNI